MNICNMLESISGWRIPEFQEFRTFFGSYCKFYIQFITNIHKYIIMFINIPLSGTALLFADDGDGNTITTWMAMIFLDGFWYNLEIVISMVLECTLAAATKLCLYKAVARARIQSAKRNCSWHLNCLEKCVSKATHYCRILIDIDFCSIIKF